MSRITGRFRDFGVLGMNPPATPGSFFDSDFSPVTRKAPGPTFMGNGGGAHPMVREAAEFVSSHRIVDKQVESKALAQWSPHTWTFTTGHGTHARTHKVKSWRDPRIPLLVRPIIFRVAELQQDDDGDPHTYHEPTDSSWNGAGIHGSKSLMDAVAENSTHPAKSKAKLTAGCELLRDYYSVKKRMEAHPPTLTAIPADMRTKYGVASLPDFAEKARHAVCVHYIDGRPKSQSRADWDNAGIEWCGIAIDRHGNRLPPMADGYYAPQITPAWARPAVHSWLVLTKKLKDLGVSHGNHVAIIRNGGKPTVVYGVVADYNPSDHVGECSIAMLKSLGFSGRDSSPAGDYIIIVFPDTGSPTQSDALRQQVAAQASFESWSLGGNAGLPLVLDLFPAPLHYRQMENVSKSGFGNPGDYQTRFPASG